MSSERRAFVTAAKGRKIPIAELCGLFGISRKTGYKWIAIERSAPDDLLQDRSRAPRRSPRATRPEIVKAVIRLRRQKPNFGPVLLVELLKKRFPSTAWPSPSTVGELLKRRGLVRPRRRHGHATPSALPLTVPQAPNDVWTMDFKGTVRAADGYKTDPLTIRDLFSRRLLECCAVRSIAWPCVQPHMRRAFQEFGLPRVLRSDNGPPFSTTGLAGLSQAAIWLIRLGIHPERIEPASPQQNGSHERMHRDLQQAFTLRRPRNQRALRLRLARFLREYNEERPHRMLNYRFPADVYTASPRPLPRLLPEVEYPRHFEVRRVVKGGDMKFGNQKYFVSSVLAGETIGLEQIDEHLWRVFFATYPIGVLDQRMRYITGSKRLVRRENSTSVTHVAGLRSDEEDS